MCVGSIVMIEIHSTYYWQVSVLYGKLCSALFISQYSIPSYESVSLTEFDTDKKRESKRTSTAKKRLATFENKKKMRNKNTELKNKLILVAKLCNFSQRCRRAHLHSGSMWVANSEKYGERWWRVEPRFSAELKRIGCTSIWSFCSMS